MSSKKWKAAGKLQNALDELPPTYDQGKGKYPQFGNTSHYFLNFTFISVPDQHSQRVLEHKLSK